MSSAFPGSQSMPVSQPDDTGTLTVSTHCVLRVQAMPRLDGLPLLQVPLLHVPYSSVHGIVVKPGPLQRKCEGPEAQMPSSVSVTSHVTPRAGAHTPSPLFAVVLQREL